MSIFKNDREVKRMIFNIDADLAERLERAREDARSFDKRLDVDTPVNKAIEKFLHKAEKKLAEMRRDAKGRPPRDNASPAPEDETDA